MYEQLEFGEVNVVQETTYPKLLQAAEDQFTYQNEMIDLRDIQISEVGTLLWEKNEARLTKPAFVQFCKRLRIPDPFAKFIPWDLLKHNINILTKVSPDVTHMFRRDDGDIVNTAIGTFIPCDHKTFIEAIQESGPNIKRATLSDINMEIDVISPTFGEHPFKNIKPKKGDIIETGLNFNNSTSGHNFTRALLFLLRLVCTNGMTMPAKIGLAKMRTKQGRELSVSVDNFIQHVQGLAIDALAIEEGLRHLNTQPLMALEFASYYKGLDKIVRDKDYLDDEVFEVDSTERQLFMANARAFKKNPEVEVIPTGVNGYNLLNNITLKAKEFSQIPRQRMEAYAGKMLTGVMN